MDNIKPNERVTISEKQLFGNANVLVDGQAVSMSGSHVKVLLDGESIPREFPKEVVRRSAQVYGGGLADQYDNQVINAIRRR